MISAKSKAHFTKLSLSLGLQALILSSSLEAYSQPVISDQPASRISDFKNLAGLAKWAAGKIADRALRSEVSAALEARAKDLSAAKSWIGSQGILLEIAVAKQLQGERMPSHLRLIAVIDHGIADSPINALTLSLSKKTFSPVASTGYEKSVSDSYFLWLKGNKTDVQVFAFPYNQDILNRAFRVQTSQVLLAERETQIERDRWIALEQSARRFQTLSSSYDVAANLIQSAKAANDSLHRIDRQLAKELERENRATAALSWLTTFGKSLEIASQIYGLNQYLGSDAVQSPLKINNHHDLYTYVSTLNIGIKAGRLELEERRSGVLRSFDGQLLQLRSEFKKKDLPLSVIP